MNAQDILTYEFNKRQRLNSSYSLRAFARDIGLSPGTLSRVLSGERMVPRRSVSKVAQRLCLNPTKSKILFTAPNKISLDGPEESTEVIRGERAPSSGETNYDPDEDCFEIISEWEHYAVLNLFKLVDFQSDISWISKRLGISDMRSKEVLQRLNRNKYISMENKKWKRLKPSLKTPEDIASRALVLAHEEELDLARKAQKELAPEWRDFSSLTLAMKKSQLPQAKKLIRQFRHEFSEIMDIEKDADEVFNLCIQFFPMTKTDSQEAL